MKISFNVVCTAAAWLFLLMLNTSCSLSKQTFTQEKEAIEEVMHLQSEAWNKGDLETYMEPYWHSDSLVFIGKNGPTYGWEKTLQNYRKSYPTPEAMGKLTFTLLNFDQLSKDTFFVVGKWHLSRSIGNVQGHFTLIFKKLGGKWKIVADHSS